MSTRVPLATVVAEIVSSELDTFALVCWILQNSLTGV